MQGLGQTGGCWKCVLLPTSGWTSQIFLWRILDTSVSLSAHRYLGAPIKLVLGLTLDSAWDLSLGSKAGTALGHCRQLLCFGQATAPPVSLGSPFCPVFSLNEDVSIYRKIGHKNWNFWWAEWSIQGTLRCQQEPAGRKAPSGTEISAVPRGWHLGRWHQQPCTEPSVWLQPYT